jgi:lipoprotein-anchoring transpeptidase ErfK/SrfK
MFAINRTRASAGGGLCCRALAISASLLLAACSHTTANFTPVASLEAQAASQYGALPDEEFPIPAVKTRYLKPELLRQQVAYDTSYPPGTIVVDPAAHFLYLVMPHGTAMRYGIGVGRAGFEWSGSATIARKAQWPKWTPPPEMIAREPRLEPYRHGMKPGLTNPLGARALYLFQNGRDTLYRLHGTNEPWTIGKNVSSGCIRLLNQDVIDLYRRTPVGTRVVVLDHRKATS